MLNERGTHTIQGEGPKVHCAGKRIVTVETLLIVKGLTQNPAKNLTMFQIPKFNFKKPLVLISMLWYPKYIDI